jgi:hypothetical protein
VEPGAEGEEGGEPRAGEAGRLGEEVADDVVDGVEPVVTGEAGLPAPGGRDPALTRADLRDAVLLGEVVEHVPLQVAGVVAVRVAGGQRQDRACHVAAADGEHVLGLVGGDRRHIVGHDESVSRWPTRPPGIQPARRPPA